MEPTIETVDIETLSSFYPLNALTENELELLAGQISVVRAKKGRVLVEYGSSDRKTLYLVKGKIELIAADGHVHSIQQGSPQSLRPISHLDPHHYTVKSLSPVEFIRIDNQIIDNLLEEETRFGEKVEDLYVSESIMNNRLFQDLYEDLVEDRLIIPTLPQVAIQIRNVVDEEVEIRKVEMVIQTDPSIAAMLLKVANSALFRTGNPVKTIEQAILKLGLKMVKSLVISYSMKDLFQSDYPYINKRLQHLWVHSAEVASVSFVLARKLKTFDPEYALLLGLLHDIGMLPILSYAARYPDIANQPQLIDSSIEQLHAEIGAIILSEWRFTDDFVVTSKEADDWYRDTQSNADYCDLVLVAQLHSFIGKAKDSVTKLVGNKAIPPLSDIPAFQKLGLETSGPEQSIAILADANQQLAEAKQILSL
ncbi:HDOD domain-containing protein [Kaarinaea lacus]